MDALVCDLDGVVYRGKEAVPGAPEAIAALKASGVRVLFCTNNSRSTVPQYVDRLMSLGIEARPEEILTSAVVTRDHLRERFPHGGRALVVGGEGLIAAADEAGLTVEDPGASGGDADVDSAAVVVVGWDPGFTYDLMRRAATAVRAGAALIASNSDASFPAEDGLWPGAGAILASIEVASGAKAYVLGKPHAPMLDAIEHRLSGASKIVAVGDRPDTDLAGASERGWGTVLVLSGVTSAEGALSLDPQPDLVVDDLAAFVSSGPDPIAPMQVPDDGDVPQARRS
ncbi:MAG TPA: HAD-IIA family hydrolase [Actinomycetota bacterium]|nr:HAD-IIA family hydrolase [Actinomycetota bacterium]